MVDLRTGGPRRLACLYVTVPMLVSVLAAASVQGQPAQIQSGPLEAPARQQAIDRSRVLLTKWLDENHIAGASVAVAADGRIVWSEGKGWDDLALGVPATARTRFRIGSVSKMLAAVALMNSSTSGRLDLDAPIQRCVPDFPVKPWSITARQLAGHLAGIRHYRRGLRARHPHRAERTLPDRP